jgi:glycosyltransferase involved in cell wall biosynthesis
MSRGPLLFVATEDWFVRSHFLPMVRRAVADGWDTTVAARLSDASAAIEAAGAHVRALDEPRGDAGPLAMARLGRRVSALVAEVKPTLIHAIALKPAVAACIGAPQTPTVLAVTGLGYLGVSAGWKAALMRRMSFHALAVRLRHGRAALLVENMEDATAIRAAGPSFAMDRIIKAPGAGIDPAAFPLLPEPDNGPVVIGLAARLVRSKGVHVLADAMRALPDAQALIAGSPDPDNPASYSPDECAAWAATANIRLLGKVDGIAQLWRQAHIACLPSLGGEGTPLSLIEAAACGRAIVTTDTPGCRDLVRHNEDGLLVPPGDAPALAAALKRLIEDAGLRARLGASARARAISEFTHAHAAAAAAAAWARALAP